MMRASRLAAHAGACYPESECRSCRYCHNSLPQDRLREHERRCATQYGVMQKDQQMAIEHSRLELPRHLVNDLQLQALTAVNAAAKKASDAARPALIARILKLGSTILDMEQLLEYVRNRAPLLIHLNLDRIADFLKDETGTYKNRFETMTSGGSTDYSARVGWESNIFHKVYDSAKPADRVKYGCLSTFSSEFGVFSAYAYGDSYLVLNNDRVRLRTTFATSDTSLANVKLATCEYCCHNLMEYTDDELKRMVRIANGNEHTDDASKASSTYRETQVHGLVSFRNDVDMLVINPRHQKNAAQMKQIEEFTTRYNIAAIPMRTDVPLPAATRVLPMGTCRK